MSGLLSCLHVYVSYCYSACIRGRIYSTVNGFHKAARADGRGGWTGIFIEGGYNAANLPLVSSMSSVVSLGISKVETSLHNFQKLG